MDTPLQPQSIPMLTPSGGVDADEKQMKITKLEQEIFTVVKQSDELKRQLTDSIKTSTLLREQVASLEADKLDRAKFVQSLERSRDELIVERTELQNARVLLQSQKDHSEGEAAKFLNEKRWLGEELIASREECANAKKELCLAQVQADEVNSEKRLIAYEKERWSHEKEILLQGRQWCMREITDRETKLSGLRIQLNQMEMRLQQERAVIVGEKEELSSRAEELQETLTKRDAELAELGERVQQMDAELRAKERLTDLYKQSLDAATNEIAALKESESRLHSRLDEVDGEMGEVQGELEHCTATNRAELAERDGRIDRREDELKKANELLQAGTELCAKECPAETPLPMETLRELLACLPLDSREHLAPLSRTFARLLVPSVNAQRAKLLANGDAFIAELRGRFGMRGCYTLEAHMSQGEVIDVLVSLKNLNDRYKSLRQEAGKEFLLDTTAISGLRRRIDAMKPAVRAMFYNREQMESTSATERERHFIHVYAEKARLASLQCELSTMEADELSLRISKVFFADQGPPGDENESELRVYTALSEMHQIHIESAEFYQKQRTNYLRMSNNQKVLLECREKLTWLETKMGEIRRGAHVQA